MNYPGVFQTPTGSRCQRSTGENKFSITSSQIRRVDRPASEFRSRGEQARRSRFHNTQHFDRDPRVPAVVLVLYTGMTTG